uniref:Uncharacterized protein n=1 Tax=Glossina palpalis gambiensis TaxID=67801 RepID=A0A1B0BEF7_9MUSC
MNERPPTLLLMRKSEQKIILTLNAFSYASAKSSTQLTAKTKISCTTNEKVTLTRNREETNPERVSELLKNRQTTARYSYRCHYKVHIDVSYRPRLSAMYYPDQIRPKWPAWLNQEGNLQHCDSTAPTNELFEETVSFILSLPLLFCWLLLPLALFSVLVMLLSRGLPHMEHLRLFGKFSATWLCSYVAVRLRERRERSEAAEIANYWRDY